MWRYAALLFLPALVLAQTPTNSVTVTASRPGTVQPDQVVFSVTVDGPLTMTLDQAVAALQGAGITAANFSSVGTTQVYSQQQPQILLEWRFTLVADLSNLKSTAATLTTIQQNVAKQKNGMSVGFSVQGTQVSPKAAQAQQCSLADLLTDARAQAVKLASAANLTVGPVLAILGGTATTASSLGGNAFTLPVTQPVCTLTVRFALAGGI